MIVKKRKPWYQKKGEEERAYQPLRIGEIFTNLILKYRVWNTPQERILLFAMEISNRTLKICFSEGSGEGKKEIWLTGWLQSRLLLRVEWFGERKAFSVVRVPSEREEAAMRPFREREKLKREEKSHVCRIKSLLVLHGIVALWKFVEFGEVPQGTVFGGTLH